MSITSSVGLISGFPTADLIDQLMAIEARPRTLVEERNAILQSQQVAFQNINAKLLSLKFSVNILASGSSFDATTVTSNNESVITASSSNGATPGTYQFTVNRLVGSQQTITQGFIDTDATSLAPGGATMTFESGRARLDSDTLLRELNGGDGTARGYIRITDRSGQSALIDLATAVSANDVINKINNAVGISVVASVDGDSFKITDLTGGASNLKVQDVGLSATATSLGIAADVAADSVTGSAVRTLGDNTLLSSLNDGNGVGDRSGLDDFRISLQDGSTVDIDLDGLVRVEDLIDEINTVSGGNITAVINAAGTGLQLTDNTAGAATFAVATLNSSTAATDLGIETTDDDADGVITGTRLIAGVNSKLLTNLNGGDGVGFLANDVSVLQSSTLLSDLFSGAGLNGNSAVVTDLRIFARDNPAASYQIDVDALTTMQDLIDAFNTTTGGRVVLTIEGNALRVTDTTGGPSDLKIFDLNGATAVSDLGIDVNGAISTQLGVDTDPLSSSLSGTGPGAIDITNRLGATTRVDLSSAESVSDIISLINAAGAGVTATLNDAGNGLLLTDTSGGSGSITIADVGADITAQTLNISGTFAAETVDTGNLQLQYIAESSRIDDLGVTRGKFIITDSRGVSSTVDLTQGNEITIADVIAEINSRGLQINARVNDNGDGILIEDTGSGAVALKVEESGSTTAADLGLLGEASAAGHDLDGSFENTISISGETLLTTTLLSALNGGDGVDTELGVDDFRITTQDGSTYDVNLDGVTDIAGVIAAISAATSGNVTATINSGETGLDLTDSTSGSSTFEIEALNDSTTAADLGIEKSDTDNDGDISGSKVIEITTLEDLVRQINDANVGVDASIINDGSVGAPYRLSLSAENSGKDGAFIFDDDGLGFGAATLAKAQDAVVFFGSPQSQNALIITSKTNTLDNISPGVTLNLLTTSDSPVTITVSRDDDTLVNAVKSMVTSFSDVISTIDSFDSYNSDSEERGLLLGDPTVRNIRTALFRMIINRNSELTGQFNNLAQLGITVSSGGGGLDFDQAKFRTALANDRDSIENLFTFKETDGDNEIAAAGVGVRFDLLLERLTDSRDGLLQSRVDTLDSQVRQNESRIEQINIRLEQKRARLEFQFNAMERALAGLQTQSQALAGFQPLTFQSSNTSNRLF